MAKLAEYINDVRLIVQEAGSSVQYDIGEEAYTRYIRRALRRYSIDKPRELAKDVTGTDSSYITINATNFPGFVEHFSRVELVEARAPVVADNEQPNYIELQEWEYYKNSTTLFLHLKNHKPTASDTIRILYTTIHTIDGLESETSDTIPTQDFDAIVYFAVSEALSALANKFAGTKDPTIRADVVNYRTKSREYREQSEYYRNLYKNWIAMPNKAASTVSDIDFGYSFGDGQPYQTHRSFSRN
jgi:hypothetical protein